ncbi:MAG: GGDEF domain-containing protein [Polyangiaceae bacterium]
MNGPASGGGRSTLVVDTKPDPNARKTRAVLTTSTGSDTGRILTIPHGDVVTMGRDASCTYRFDDPSVSSLHARIVTIGAEHMFADNKSTNGTFVNEVRIADPVHLRNGDQIRLGPKITLRFALLDEDEEAALKRMYEAALYDGLTHVFNRKHLEERLDAEVAFAVRHSTELSVAILDIDFFKKVNDTYGHPAGDAVLKHVANILGRTLRTEDLLARYGGEEFVVVARGIQLANACVAAERLRSAVGSSPISWTHHLPDGSTTQVDLSVTSSAGVASLTCCQTKDKPTLLRIADQRLYRAKQAGRNRVVGG